MQKRASVPGKDAMSSKQVCIAAEMLTIIVIDLASCDFAVVVSRLLQNQDIKQQLMDYILHRQRPAVECLQCTKVHAQEGYSSGLGSHLPLHAS